jgi:Flp pilus assembly protein CpaB
MKNRKTLIGVAGLILLLVVNVVAFEVVMAWRINLVSVYVAKNNILPRTMITNEDLQQVKLPKSMVNDSMVLDANQIVGKYTEIQGKIPQGSPIYRSMLFDAADLPDYPSLLLKPGQVGFAVGTDIIKSLGNSLVVDQKVDLYVTITTSSRKVVADCLVQQVRVIGVKDRNGLNLDHEKSNGLPYVIVLAIDESIIDYLKVAAKIGVIDLLPTTTNSDEESIFQGSSTVLKYLST